MNSKLQILNTDLIYGPEPTHMVHYMTQCALAGKIPREFLGGKEITNTSDATANFKPVHHDDVIQAVAHAMANPKHGQFSVRGDEKLSIKDLLNLVEHSCEREEGSTKKHLRIPFLKLSELTEEWFVGITHDRNMRIMLQHFQENEPDCPCPGTDFFEASGL